MRSPVWGDLACLAAGGLAFLAFSPWNLPVVAVGSLAVLFRAVLRADPARAFRRGWLYGAATFGVGLWWIAESFQYRAVGIGPAIALTASLVCVLALYPAIFGWASAHFLKRVRRRLEPGGGPHEPPAAPRTGPGAPTAAASAALWWLPAAWTLVEWLRGTLFSGFTWLQLGYAGIDSPLAAYAPIGGSYALGLVIALTAACLALARAAPRRAVLGAALVAALSWAGGAAVTALEGHTAWTRPAGAPLAVLVVQGNVPQDEKWVDAGRRAALDRYARLTAEHRTGVDLVVWPETAIPYFAAAVRPFLNAAGAAAERAGYVLFAGLLTFDLPSGRAYNSVARIAAPEAVEPIRYYHKRRLVPFSERIPLEVLLAPLARWLGLPAESFEAGAAQQPALHAGGHEAAVSVCYEVTFGAPSARALGDARLLVNVSNDAWFGDTWGPRQHLQMTRMRALEQGRWLVRATNTGRSALVGPDGRVAAAAPPFEAAVLKGEVIPRTGRTPYARWRDTPVLVVLALMLLAGGWRAGRKAVPFMPRRTPGPP